MGQPDRETAPTQPTAGAPVPAPAVPPPAPAAPTPNGPESAQPGGPAIRASDRERDAATHRLQDAFAEGRLDDSEFDERMRAALTACTRDELAMFLADLPEAAPAPAGGRLVPAPGPRPGRLALGIKGPVRRAGRWRVPEHYTAVVYKGRRPAGPARGGTNRPGDHDHGGGIQIADRDPGAARGAGRGGRFAVTTDAEGPSPVPLPPDAPAVHVRGYAYKGSVGTWSGPPAT